MKKLVIFTSIFLLFSINSMAVQDDTPSANMETIKKDFLNPSSETRPGCYWYWINDNISKSGITKDLEAMARVGIGRAFIGHIFARRNPTDTPAGDVKFMSDKWWEAVQWAVKEGDRCGVDIGFFNSPGWSQSGGPWMKPSESMRYLGHSETVIIGGQRIDQIIPVPEIKTFPKKGGAKPVQTGPKFTEKDFQDVRLVAFRQPETEENDIDMKDVTVTSKDIESVEKLFDGSEETFVNFGGKGKRSKKRRRSNKKYIIDMFLPKIDDSKSGIQSISIKPLDVQYTLKCRIESSKDNETYEEIANYSEQRGHQGPKNKDAILIPFRETKDRYIRLKISVAGRRNKNKPVKIAEISLSRQAVLAGYVRKQLGETSPSAKPPWNSYIWDKQIKSVNGSVVVSGDVVDLTDKMDAKGRLRWDAPKGRWVILRMGMIPIGTMSNPTSEESQGLEVDKMSRKHVRTLLDGMVGEFLRRTPAKDRKAFKYVIADSYETGPQNWTDGFTEKFKERFKYSPEQFMPVLTGRIVDSPDVSTRFLWDMRRLIVELIAYDYVGGLRKVLNENNLTLWLENYGHWGFPSEFLLYGSQSDQVGGEFWEQANPQNNVECRAAASCCHIYGKKSVYAEAFTSNRNFKQSPASIKSWCDWVFGAGINHLILHVYIHQPTEKKPGIIQWFGTVFNRHNTWFEQSKAFIDYTRRCSVLLKAGLPVMDVAYYIGENAPAMAGPRDPELPDGYDFDYINSDVLINRVSVKNGRIVVKNGPAYAVLVLPKQKVMRPEVAKAIEKLVKKGAIVIGPKPNKSPSLENYPACDKNLQKTANKVWGKVNGKNIKMRKYGNGRVYDEVNLEEVFAKNSILPDVKVISDKKLRCAAAAGKMSIKGKGGIIFKHRAGKNTDIYFLANTRTKGVDFTASFRMAGRNPSLWNADNREIIEDIAFSQKDGRTLIPLHLEPSESIFVIFREKISKTAEGRKKLNSPDYKTIATLDDKWTVRFKGQQAPKKITFDTLLDWSEHTNQAIKYYAGRANYENSFTLPRIAKGKSILLELGKVGVIATVTVNGKEAGIVWTTPWRLDITDHVRSGKNELQILVANTWNNRLIADSKLPKEKRRNYVSQPYRFNKRGPLVKGGLVGPVKILQRK